MIPIEFHCHGVGTFDFTQILTLDLHEIDSLLADEGVVAVLTLYLRRNNLHDLLNLAERFAAERRSGKLNHVAGLALEGPLLASSGGTPRSGVWQPSAAEWTQIASCGPSGLKYVVLSPDSLPVTGAPSVEWVFELLLDHGISPALGHFRKDDPLGSARRVEQLLDLAHRRRATKSCEIVTDHLFNDMPRNFKHCWRTQRARRMRIEELEELDLQTWSLQNLHETAGPVPAALMRAAADERLTACLNFDGEHVDLAICRRVVELIGTSHLIAMTDRIDGHWIGGERLIRRRASTLLYQSSGIVAAGSQGIRSQMQNMKGIGLGAADVRALVSDVPARVLGISPAALSGSTSPGGPMTNTHASGWLGADPMP